MTIRIKLTTSKKSTWKEWIDTLDMLFIASGINDTKHKKALQKLYWTLNDDTNVFHFLDLNFKSKINLTFERKKFYNLHQHENETISAFVTHLWDASRECDFENYSVESAIIDHVISKCLSNELHCQFLQEQLNLKTLLEISFTAEIEIEKKEEHVNTIALSDDNIKQSINKNSKIPPSYHQIGKKVVHCYGCGSSTHNHGSVVF